MFGASKKVRKRLKSLEQHLKQENPMLVSAVKSYRQLDSVGYAMGLLDADDSFTTQIPWWPLISILGTFSAGKSTFINHYLGHRLQSTGNQAVDDRFTVICYSRDNASHELPGVALDADPRFPFYQFSEELDKVEEGEGRRVDAYLQLKTSPADVMNGMILIDSPGFDADAQRTGILRITDHIVSLSDLVLVFFDARHPEPGAMRDTLKHLVASTVNRADSSKFVYVLNQIDATAREDNPEEVVASWQRALATEGLTAGRFFTIYNPDAAVAIEDDDTRKRFEEKRDHDLADMHERMRQVGVERAYRIIGALENTAYEIEDTVVPKLREQIKLWARHVLWWDLGLYLTTIAILLSGTIKAGYWNGFTFAPPWLESFTTSTAWQIVVFALGVTVVVGTHFLSRHLSFKYLYKRFARKLGSGISSERLLRAFRANTRPWRSIFSPEPMGWGWLSKKRMRTIHEEADRYVQSLNDRFTNPSGGDRD
ncbi:dynamin family protein [Solemya pervernicosa gill symbiont]|uniref:Dynamin family protein n=2 Tax=Gammaproteobacteria incertae sedis TaxID=118884 RepID=A0A1T2L6P6_9GAMM|nr:dynamin family protein [Candidatus Reidiella endopervernicosa]OOZ40777.1 dynamin family protein [Solemya pervernicosa gill symbiont]QKQ26387.1 dynamin family protein [Candidatus Reidiella endopervernicosa]